MIEVSRLIVDLGQLVILFRMFGLLRVYLGPSEALDYEEAATPSSMLEDL